MPMETSFYLAWRKGMLVQACESDRVLLVPFLGAVLFLCRQGSVRTAGHRESQSDLKQEPVQPPRPGLGLHWVWPHVNHGEVPRAHPLDTPVTSSCSQQSALAFTGTGQVCSGASYIIPAAPKRSGKENTPLLQFLDNFTSHRFTSASFTTQPRTTTAARFARGHLGWASDSLTTLSITEVWLQCCFPQ